MLDLTYEHLCDIEAHVERTDMVGPGPKGMRFIGNVTGGSVTGPRLKGDVLPSGADWALVRADGVLEIDVRAAFKTHDGAVIYATYGGRWHWPAEIAGTLMNPETAESVDPSKYYFRTNPVFETGDERYAWLNKIIAVGVGRRTKRGVAYRVYEIK